MPAAEAEGSSQAATLTSSASEQDPLVTVHLNTVVAPIVKPVTPEVGEAGVVATPVPETVVHSPVPTTGVFPAKVVVVALQTLIVDPASAVVTCVEETTSTSAKELPQPLAMVHRKVVVAPIVNPVTPEVGEFGDVATPVPETVVHVPVPSVGVFPAKVVVVLLHIS